MPALAEQYEHVTPEYKTLPGWCVPTYGAKDGERLPKAALEYLGFISDFLQVEIGMISTGPDRDATIDRKSTRLNSSHQIISYAVFCLKKKKTKKEVNHQSDHVSIVRI